MSYRNYLSVVQAGFEPALAWFWARCLCRWATGPSLIHCTEQDSNLHPSRLKAGGSAIELSVLFSAPGGTRTPSRLFRRELLLFPLSYRCIAYVHLRFVPLFMSHLNYDHALGRARTFIRRLRRPGLIHLSYQCACAGQVSSLRPVAYRATALPLSYQRADCLRGTDQQSIFKATKLRHRR